MTTINQLTVVRMQTPVKRKIVLHRAQAGWKNQGETATFGRLRENHTNCGAESLESSSKFLLQVCQVMRFNQQLSMVESFHSLKGNAFKLKETQDYLEHKIRSKRLRNAFRILRRPVNFDSDFVLNTHSRLQQNTRPIRQLQQRVSRLEGIKDYRPCGTRSKSMKDILLSHRQELSRLVLQISTEESISLNIENHPGHINSYRNRSSQSMAKIQFLNLPRASLTVDCHGDQQRLSTSRKSLLILKSKFVRLR